MRVAGDCCALETLAAVGDGPIHCGICLRAYTRDEVARMTQIVIAETCAAAAIAAGSGEPGRDGEGSAMPGPPGDGGEPGLCISPEHEALLAELARLQAALATHRLTALTAERTRTRRRKALDAMGLALDLASNDKALRERLVSLVARFASRDQDLKRIVKAALRAPSKRSRGRPEVWTEDRLQNLLEMYGARITNDDDVGWAHHDLVEWLRSHAGQPGTLLDRKTIIARLKDARALQMATNRALTRSTS